MKPAPTWAWTRGDEMIEGRYDGRITVEITYCVE
jgi:hypothetical protein